MQIWKNVVCLGLILTLTVAGVADEKKSAQKGKKAPAPTQRFLNGIELTAEQKDKVAALDKELSAEFQKLQKSRRNSQVRRTGPAADRRTEDEAGRMAKVTAGVHHHSTERLKENSDSGTGCETAHARRKGQRKEEKESRISRLPNRSSTKRHAG